MTLIIMHKSYPQFQKDCILCYSNGVIHAFCKIQENGNFNDEDILKGVNLLIQYLRRDVSGNRVRLYVTSPPSGEFVVSQCALHKLVVGTPTKICVYRQCLPTMLKKQKAHSCKRFWNSQDSPLTIRVNALSYQKKKNRRIERVLFLRTESFDVEVHKLTLNI